MRGRNPWHDSIFQRRRSRILVVDDEKYILALIHGSLPQAKYQVSLAHDAEEAKTLLATTCFDLAIFDVKMPGESGIELLKEVRRSHPRLEVLMMTGGLQIDMELAAVTTNVPDVLLKPILRNQLLAAVEAGLRAAEERRNQVTLEPNTATVAFARQLPEAKTTADVQPASEPVADTHPPRAADAAALTPQAAAISTRPRLHSVRSLGRLRRAPRRSQRRPVDAPRARQEALALGAARIAD